MPDGNVCYVGKGTGTRMMQHRSAVFRKKYGCQARLYEKLDALIRSGKDFEPRKVFETDDELEALKEENRRIRLYGLDNLFNASYKSGSRAGWMTEEQRITASKKHFDYYARMVAEYGYKMTPEHRANLSKTLKGKAKHAGFGKVLSEAKRGHAPRHDAKSAYVGVTWRPRKQTYIAKLCLHKNIVELGYFKLEIDAAWTYDNAYEEHFGARPNSTPKEHTVTRFAGKGIKRPASFIAKCEATRRRNLNRPVGVQFKEGKWWVTLYRNKKSERLGRYFTELEARVAYDDRFFELFGRRPNGTPSPVASFALSPFQSDLHTFLAPFSDPSPIDAFLQKAA